MGWLTALTSFFINLISASNQIFKSAMNYLLQKLYLLFIPFIAVLKLVFDFLRSMTDMIVAKFSALSAFDHSGLSTFSVVSFCNYFFPIDEILITTMLLFTFFVGCQIIATMRGIKQTILF